VYNFIFTNSIHTLARSAIKPDMGTCNWSLKTACEYRPNQ